MSSTPIMLDRPALGAGIGARAGPVAGPFALAVTAGSLTASAGGYWPTAWGWSALALAWLAVVALCIRTTLNVSRLEILALGALAAFALWTLASFTWSIAPTQTMLEAERTLVYLTGFAGAVVVLRRTSLPLLLGGLLAATTAVCGWALLARLLPERVGAFDPAFGYRLSAPLGYWNGLGILATLGILLALALAARAASLGARTAAAACVPILTLTLYFTFSRGAWLALAVGLALALALDRDRLQLTTAALAIGAPAAGAVAYAASLDALVRRDAALAEASAEGRRLLPVVAALALAAAAASLGLAAGQRRVSISPSARRMCVLALLAGAAAVLVVVSGRYGSPATIVRDAYGSFVSPPPKEVVDLNDRLFTFSGNGRPVLWQAALDDFGARPLTGSGAGSYERYWLEYRDRGLKVRDAHSLYVETLAELGVPGLALLLLVLGAPLAALVAARRESPLVPMAGAAYGAFLVHAGLDWDWELTGVTLTALLCGAGILAAARQESDRPPSTRLRAAGVAALVVVGAAALGGLAGNLALKRSVDAALDGDWADSQRWALRARQLQPWSSQPWRRLALAQEKAVHARPLFLEAIERDATDWELWMELSWASTGPARTAAVERATKLNPLSPELADVRRQLKEEARP